MSASKPIEVKFMSKYRYVHFDVCKRMLQLMTAERSTQCTDIIGRLCEIIRIAKDLDDPLGSLELSGLIFHNTHFYVHRKLLASKLLIPESLLCKRLDQVGMIVQKNSALNEFGNILENTQGWEVRVYSPRSDCKKMINMIGRNGLFLAAKKAAAEEFAPSVCDCSIDCLTKVKLPDRLIVHGTPMDDRRSEGKVSVLVADGPKIGAFTISLGDEPGLPMVALPTVSAWNTKE